VIRVNRNIRIGEDEIDLEFCRSSGPGGQNVNKVSSAVQLRFDVDGSPSLPGGVKYRLKNLAGSRMTKDGVLIIDARNHRTQERNRAEAIDRLTEMLREAAKPPKVRKKTRPTAASRRRRLQSKRRRSEKKKLRKPVRRDRGS
jgi:ribosome-associated protein